MKATIIVPNISPFPLTVETDDFIHFQGGAIYTYNDSPYIPVEGAENVSSFSLVVSEKTPFRVIIPEMDPFPLELDREGNILFANNTILLYANSTYTVLAENITTVEIEWL
jgi:hypothetical protein